MIREDLYFCFSLWSSMETDIFVEDLKGRAYERDTYHIIYMNMYILETEYIDRYCYEMKM